MCLNMSGHGCKGVIVNYSVIITLASPGYIHILFNSFRLFEGFKLPLS